MPFRLLIGLLFCAFGASAQNIELNPKHPDRYTVVQGDTLWDISSRFLKNPWQWPELWHDNPQIKNPHWIYPGDTLALSMIDGQQSLSIERPSELRLSPSIRVSPMSQAIPTIPIDSIRAFLNHPKLVEQNTLENAPHIINFAGEHLIAGAGDKIYAQSIDSESPSAFMVFRKGVSYQDGLTGEALGHEAIYIAEAALLSPGHPATLQIEQSAREIQIGDSLLPMAPEKIQMNYQPHAPNQPIRGQIVGLQEGVTQIGRYQVVVIDKGQKDGLEIGHVLQIFQISRDRQTNIKLPEENIGLLMVFQSFERLSFALVMKAASSVRLYDGFKNP